MSRNFNVGSRSIESAVAMFLDGARQRKELSFSSVAAHKARASLFLFLRDPMVCFVLKTSPLTLF